MSRELPPRWRFRRGFYWYRVPVGMEPHWEDCQEYPLGKTWDEAMATWARKMSETYPVDTVTIGDLFDRMLVSEIPGMLPHQAETYITAFRRLRPVFGRVRMEKVVPEHTQSYLNLASKHQLEGKGPGLLGAHNDIDVLTNALSQAVLWRLLPDNPLLEAPRKDRPITRRYLESWEIQEIMFMDPGYYMDPRRKRNTLLAKCYVALKLKTGASRRELLSLRLSQIRQAGIEFDEHVAAWDSDGIMAQAVEILRGMPPTHREDYLIVNRSGEGYLGEDGLSPGFSSLWRRFVTDVLNRTAIKEPFQEMHLVAAPDDQAAIATGLLLSKTSPQST